MARKEQLRVQRENTVINQKSKREDKQCQRVVRERIIPELEEEFGISLIWRKSIKLTEIIRALQECFPNVSFASPERETSFMTPDGGVTLIKNKEGKLFPVLIAEVKNQGTNDSRLAEGKKRQAQGNAVERLGKNVIGFRTYLLSESIFPFVCFGDGCDFEDGSSILDRVLTIAMFGELNTDHTTNEGPRGIFNRGSYYFRAPYWTAEEEYQIMKAIGRKSIFYYFSKYGDDSFVTKK